MTDRMIPYRPRPRRWRLPSRDNIADAAESASRTFMSLALMADMLSRVLRSVSHELKSKHRRRL